MPGLEDFRPGVGPGEIFLNTVAAAVPTRARREFDDLRDPAGVRALHHAAAHLGSQAGARSGPTRRRSLRAAGGLLQRTEERIDRLLVRRFRALRPGHDPARPLALDALLRSEGRNDPRNVNLVALRHVLEGGQASQSRSPTNKNEDLDEAAPRCGPRARHRGDDRPPVPHDPIRRTKLTGKHALLRATTGSPPC